MSQAFLTRACISLALAIFLMDHNARAVRVKLRAPIEDRYYQIFLNKHVVDVTDGTTLWDLKIEYWKRSDSDILPEHQTVIFNGKQLENDTATNAATIHQLGIRKSDNLRITSGLRGGLAYADFREGWASDYDFVGRLVTFVRRGGEMKKGTCTALVQGSYALTAAHCFSSAKGGAPLPFWVLHTTDGERRLVDGKVHDLYDPSEDDYDVAWVKLDRPHYAQEVVLDDAPVPIDVPVLMAGFGIDEHGTSGNFGVAEFLTITCDLWTDSDDSDEETEDNTNNTRANNTHSFAQISDDEVATTRHAMSEASSEDLVICAAAVPSSRSSQTSTCGGDSGGPWWRSTKIHGKYRIFGIHSFGYDGECGAGSAKSGIAALSHAKTFLEKYTPFEWLEDPQSNASSSSSGPARQTIGAHQASAHDANKTVRGNGVTNDGSRTESLNVPTQLDPDKPSTDSASQGTASTVPLSRVIIERGKGVPLDTEGPPTRNVWSVSGL